MEGSTQESSSCGSSPVVPGPAVQARGSWAALDPTTSTTSFIPFSLDAFLFSSSSFSFSSSFFFPYALQIENSHAAPARRVEGSPHRELPAPLLISEKMQEKSFLICKMEIIAPGSCEEKEPIPHRKSSCEELLSCFVHRVSTAFRGKTLAVICSVQFSHSVMSNSL